MTRFKHFGLVALATFAIGAVSGSGAQAAEFHSTVEKTFLFGEQEGESVFKTTAGNVKCKSATFDSLTAQVAEGGSGTDWKSKMVAVQPQYSTCTAFGQTATIDNPPPGTGSACDLYYMGDFSLATLTGTPLPATGGLDTNCEFLITVSAAKCNIVINQQTPGTPKVTFSNTMFEGKSAVKAASSLEGISYKVEGAKGSICGEPGVATNGKYEGSAVIRGYKSSTHTAAEQVALRYE